MDVEEPDAEVTIQLIVTDVSEEFSDLDQTEITTIAREEFTALAARSKAPAFVGILSERRTRERLARVHRRSA